MTPTNKALEAARTAEPDWQAIALGHARQLREQSERTSRELRVATARAESAEAERDALKRQLEKAEHALKPFAELAVALGSEHQPPDSYVGGGITHAHLLAASRASSAEKEARASQEAGR